MKKLPKIFIYKVIFLFVASIFITSCSNTWDSIKRGLTGQKQKSTDEFFIKKKDPLILPPDYEDLPTPGERTVAKQEVLTFEDAFKETLPNEESSSSGSTEESILKKIRKR